MRRGSDNLLWLEFTLQKDRCLLCRDGISGAGSLAVLPGHYPLPWRCASACCVRTLTNAAADHAESWRQMLALYVTPIRIRCFCFAISPPRFWRFACSHTRALHALARTRLCGRRLVWASTTLVKFKLSGLAMINAVKISHSLPFSLPFCSRFFCQRAVFSFPLARSMMFAFDFAMLARFAHCK